MQSTPEVESDYTAADVNDAGASAEDLDKYLPSPEEIVQSKVSQSLREMRNFLQGGGYVAEKTDGCRNIIDSVEKKCYNVPAEVTGEFFRILEACRAEGRTIHFGERQYTDTVRKSGIVLDFDRFQATPARDITTAHIIKLIQRVGRILYNTLDNGGESFKFTAFCIRKPAPTMRPIERGKSAVYKDGFHLLVPEIQVTQGYKKYLIDELNKDGIEKIFGKLPFLAEKPISTLLDSMSASFPVHFFGCSKPESVAYPLENVYGVEVEDEGVTCNEVLVPELLGRADVNLVYEMALCFYAPVLCGKPTWLVKRPYSAKPTIETLLQLRAEKTAGGVFSDDVIRQEEEDISIVNITSPKARHIMELLNALPLKFATEYALWYRAICAIAHTGIGEDYKNVARAFSRRVPGSWNQSEFERVWNEACAGKYTGAPATRWSINKWAKESAPEKFAEIEKRNYDRVLKQITFKYEGIINHTNAGLFVHMMTGDKFVSDEGVNPVTGRAGLCWWEFVTARESMRKGEIYKWRQESIPANLHLFISDKLPLVYDDLRLEIRENKDKTSEEALAKWWKVVDKNFKKSQNDLGNDGYQNSVVRQCLFRFLRRGFAAELDSYEDVIGVGNGVLKIGHTPVLITGYHEYKISKYTETDYIPFDPENPCVKRLLAAFRDIFPEKDVFEFMMFHAATGLDFREAACIFLMCVGGGRNGKSFFAKMVHNTLGNTYCASGKPALLTDRNERGGDANSAQMQMKDKRYFYFDEFNKCELLNTARMKSIVNPGWQTGRDLFTKQTNFKTTCNAIALSNFDFIIDTTDHGTWRRIYYYRNKVKFCENPNPANQYERKVDKDLMDKCTNAPEYKSAMLAIMVHYYTKLCAEYGGDLSRVPVPTIWAETAEFRNRQDALNKYITTFVVSSPAAEPIGISFVAQKYNEWYTKNIRKCDQSIIDIQAQLENSALARFLVRTLNGMYLHGHRLKSFPEEPLGDGEASIQVHENMEVAVAAPVAVIPPSSAATSSAYSQVDPDDIPELINANAMDMVTKLMG